jgi:hypothetical protein
VGLLSGVILFPPAGLSGELSLPPAGLSSTSHSALCVAGQFLHVHHAHDIDAETAEARLSSSLGEIKCLQCLTPFFSVGSSG